MNILSPEFQTELLKVILQDHSFLQNYRNIISVDLFKDNIERELVRYTLNFFDKYNNTPAKNSLYNFMISDNFDIEDVKKETDYYYKEEIDNIEYIKDSTVDFVKKNKLKDVILKCGKLLEKSQYDEIYKSVKDIVYGFNTDDDIGDFFWESKKQVLEQIDLQEPFIPTGINELDDVMSGGAVRGTLNVIMAPPNRGKSTLLINIGKNAVLNGFKVIHYSFELSKAICKRRYFMSMTKMSKNELRTRKRTAYNKILDLAENIIEENLLIKKFPANVANCNDIRRHINSVVNKHNFIPDLILFDYADIMGILRPRDQKRLEIEETYYDLRNIAEELNTVNWTASQTNRGWKEKEFVTMEDFDESYKKAAASDVIISCNQTLEEKKSHPQCARLFVTKNRDDESQIEIDILTDWSKAWIGNP